MALSYELGGGGKTNRIGERVYAEGLGSAGAQQVMAGLGRVQTAVDSMLPFVPGFSLPMGITAYHGTPSRWAGEPGRPLGRFDFSKTGSNLDEGWLGKGAYFTTGEDVAGSIKNGRHILEADIDLRNPLELSASFGKSKYVQVREALGLEYKGLTKETAKEIADVAMAKGYDGVVLDYSPTGWPHKEIVAFTSDSIKPLKWSDVK